MNVNLVTWVRVVTNGMSRYNKFIIVNHSIIQNLPAGRQVKVQAYSL